jgi:hypothetical protein
MVQTSRAIPVCYAQESTNVLVKLPVVTSIRAHASLRCSRWVFEKVAQILSECAPGKAYDARGIRFV